MARRGNKKREGGEKKETTIKGGDEGQPPVSVKGLTGGIQTNPRTGTGWDPVSLLYRRLARREEERKSTRKD
ncbi:hypothetical protein I7I51_00222 [Histoplasma capsulatum]|uniref:Uncharacterized protein n=1 Tax=Ajellomyces capsulatus TaxID=5037 RepID=A0A8A1MBG0_AJECA|nr:predicted protein [Histoplasma mississippiense (nom. inval.)]EDN08588.1 predicted protein [Histoplasma mississippiense (nom. inval.)]QSS63165.1 hypothetical protein I7I51_00222 [Histoplasma capsulatum]